MHAYRIGIVHRWKGVLGNVSYVAEFQASRNEVLFSVTIEGEYNFRPFPLHYKIQSKIVIIWDREHIIHFRTFITLKPVKGATPDLREFEFE